MRQECIVLFALGRITLSVVCIRSHYTIGANIPTGILPWRTSTMGSIAESGVRAGLSMALLWSIHPWQRHDAGTAFQR
jgi:hypothetical protein